MEITKQKLAKLYKLVFLVPLVVFPPMLNLFELAKLSYLFAIIGIWLLLAASVLVEKKKIQIRFPKLFCAYLVLMILSFAVSTIFSVSPFESIFGTYNHLQGLVTNFLYLAHALIVFYLADEDFLDSVLKITVWIGSILSVYAIAQKLGFDPLNQNVLGIFSGRSSSFLGQPNFLGQFLLYPILILFSNLFHKKGNLPLQAILLVLNLLALYFSYNRASILALLIGIFALIVLNLKSKKTRTIAVVTGLLCFVVLTFALVNNNFRSLGSRAVIWSSAIESLHEAVFIGTGPETSYRSLQKNVSPNLYDYEPMFSIIGNAHSETFEVLLNRGLLGLIPYIIYIYFLLYTLFKTQDPTDQLLALILSTALITNQFSFSSSSHYIFLIFFAVSLLKRQNFKSKNLKLNSLALASITLALGAVVFFTGLRAVQADLTSYKATDHYFKSEVNESVETHQKAQELNPFFSEYYRMPIIFLADDVSPKQTEQWLQNYSRVTSDNFRSYLYKAQNSSNYSKYIALAAKEVPNYPLVYQLRAELAVEDEDYKALVDSSLKLLSFIPNYPEWDSEKKRIFRKTHGRLFEILSTTSNRAGLRNDSDIQEQINLFLEVFIQYSL
jgi:O-antigen ligase